ncbi:MAG: exodeoxyribonuclease VII small subunit [Eubacteriales bacterium]|nr:exodeoxyribonuclease VII small subunit [Eubacteriales bacterium]MDD4461062.1 exodeoxyribonuclease VII small subunit [Eubacteriales bacterium]
MTQNNNIGQAIDQPADAGQPEKETGLSYEKATAELEVIVHRLESGELSLEQSVELFQKGMNLAKICTTRLNEIEARITQLIEQADGQIVEAELGEKGDD